MTDQPQYEAWGATVTGRFAKVFWRPETDSTNVDAKAHLAVAGAGPAAFLADYQRAGRGRLDRRWDAPAGTNILLSVALAPGVPGHRWGVYPTALGIAAVDALDHPSVGLKWPNDLVTRSGAKLGGMLAEATGEGLVIGFGINVAWPGAGDEAPTGATSVAMLDRQSGPALPTRAQLVVGILERFGAWCDRLEVDPARTANQLQDHYVRRCFTIDAIVRVELVDGSTIVGTAIAVTPDGHLVVEEEQAEDAVVKEKGSAPTRHEIAVGDVHHLRRADPDSGVGIRRS